MAKKGSRTEKIDVWEGEYKKLGNRIKTIRIAQGFTSAEAFSNERGLSRAQYAKYENGKNLQYSNLLYVVEALNVSLMEFFGDDFKDSPKV
ncbi:helix-turn-helix transcriptional regulator [Mucilaginibacter sp. 14171R-50]|uniref:helix-turn-helix domain-containing protein n=1 Tax=Mucilaginibacter sp. 14171R-50 TaxID=2703789 RepID=UPI00138C43FA|nr:helix-turn-helix transcriptional regulator [Mucilaginibacter sp. 14171R-50]QHS56565.1 helix-turn-helix transcriptional regulator [Mucilaginibacter sp. 14171R-50]